MPGSIRVAYTLEQSWHRVPGGTAVAALRVADALAHEPGVELIGVAGRHRREPLPAFRPPIPVRQLPLGSPLLYEAWLRWERPAVERATGPVDVAHATSLIPCPTSAPLVVTMHDLAWRHHPEHFTRRGVRVFDRSLAITRRRADLVLCASQATLDDCVAAGISDDRLRHVPLGVDVVPATRDAVRRVREAYGLPSEYLLFVGTVEPRKNLTRLAEAIQHLPDALPLVVAGADGWGDAAAEITGDVRFLGFVPDADLPALYAGALVFCYPSEREGFGLPVLEAMAQGTPVVTSLGTSTEEVAAGAAVLVDPFDSADIARGIVEALARRDELAVRGRRRATFASWERTAALTASAYGELAG